jgi:DNA polymerase-3 subunit gamma/tau
MSYLVLARRWRPQRFEEVIGQQHITKTLQNAISMNRMAHAYLFSGSRGVGKTTVARILAKALNCKEGPTPQPCDQCGSCLETMSGVSLDVQEIDGASNTGVDDVRELREGLRYRPAASRYRIYIIDEVHMLSNAAFNALLKTLEEPPSHVVFIFATTEPHKIPVTILSRCQRFDFKRIALKDVVMQLRRISDAEDIEISDETLTLISREAQGSLRDAQSLLDQVIAYSGEKVSEEAAREVLGILDRQWLFRTSESLIRRDARGCLEVVEGLFQHGFPLTYFYNQLVEHLRNLMVVNVDQNPQDLLHLPDHEVAELRDQAAEISSPDLHLWFEILVGAEEEIRRSSYPRYLLELLLVKMAQLDRTEDIEGILSRLEALCQTSNSCGLVKGDTELDSPSSESRGASEVKEPSAKTWEAFIHFLKVKRQSLSSILEQGRFLGCCEEGKIRVAFPTAFHVEQVSEKAKGRELEALCQEFFGGSMSVSPVLDGKGINFRANNARQKKHQIQVGVKSHPVVQEALKVFGGHIESVLIPESNEAGREEAGSRIDQEEVDGERAE